MTENDSEAKVPCRKLAVVVGAGVAGVQAARALLRAGFDALILEQGRGIGGVWRRNYHSFALQVPWSCYTFPEFHYDKAPPEIGEKAKREGFPSGNTVQEYIAAYCAHFDLERHILLGAKVVHLSGLPSGRWSVRFRQAVAPGQAPDRGALKIMEADVVVLATGMYYSPYVPAVPGLAAFKGRVVHARDFTSVDGLQGKRVLVLGAGKSAHDCAVIAASPAAGAAAVTAVFRQAHWPLPRVLFGIPFHKVVYTRFTAAMLPMYYTGQGRPAKRLKHALLSPLKRLFWGTLEGHVARKMRLRGPLRPEAGFVEDLFFGGQIQDGSWNEAVNAGRIRAVQGSLAEVLPSGVRLADGTLVECDVVIFATGYAKDYSLFDAVTATRLVSPCPMAEGLHLYRSILSPWVPNLYFIGSEASSFNNVLTSGLQSLWMVHHLLGSIRLPASTELVKDIQDQRTWRQGVMPPQCYSSSTIMLYQQRYHDQLVADMHQATRRKRAHRRGGSEYFGVYTSEDYSDMFEDAAVPAPAGAAAVPPPRTAAEVIAAAVTLMPAAAAIGARLDLAVLPSAARRGGAAAAGAEAGQRGGALLAVCGANSGAAAIAVAPDMSGVGSGPNAVAAAQTVVGSANSFLGSFDSPRAAGIGRRDGTAAAAAVGAEGEPTGRATANTGPPPPSSPQLPEFAPPSTAAAELAPPAAAAAAAESAPPAAAAAAEPTEPQVTEGLPIGPQHIAAEIDSSTNAAGCASVAPAEVAAGRDEGAAAAATTALPSGDAATAGVAAGAGSAADTRRAAARSPDIHTVSRPSTATSAFAGRPSGSGAAAGSGAGDSAAPSASSMSAAMAAAGGGYPRRGAAGAGGPSMPSYPLPLVQRVKLQVLHLFDRSPGGSLLPAAAAGAGEDEILEFNLHSGAGVSSRVPEGSIAATSLAATAGGVVASGSLCADAMRHVAPNAYNELVNTLEVH